MTVTEALQTEALARDAIAILATLVGFDTTSRRSNLALIEWVEAYLAEHGVTAQRVPNTDGTKSNLMATVGPQVPGGIVLSGHTDVVPIDGQAWTSDPWVLTEHSGRLYGRGACDMKGFLALSLAAVPALVAAPLKRPMHLAFSYDEEIGCLGAPDLIAAIAAQVPAPAAVIVGEPTGMVAVRGHKGVATYRVKVTGVECHSSLTHLGVSANMAAIPLLAALVELSQRLQSEADPDCPFTPKGCSLTVGQINGGTASNILARECVILFDLRFPPGISHDAVLADIFALGGCIDATLKTQAPEAGLVIEHRSLTPAFAPEIDGAAETLARHLTGDNGPPRVVPYAAEAGQFQGAGFSTVICGPGSIDQAHQPDEFVERSQMERGATFMTRLIETLSAA